jgi:hypothetical protein
MVTTATLSSKRAGAWTYTNFLARDLTATVAFTCSDGTASRTLAVESGEEKIFGGVLSATLTPRGFPRSSLADSEQYAELEAKLSGTRATGTIKPGGGHGEWGSCSGDPIAFSVSRTG